MREKLLEAFVSHARGHVDKHIANIEVYLHNPAGIGEHPDVAQALDTQIERYANAKEKYEACYDLIHNKPQTTLTE